MAEWIAHWHCNYGVQGSIPDLGSKHFSFLFMLSSAKFPYKILKFNRNVQA